MSVNIVVVYERSICTVIHTNVGQQSIQVIITPILIQSFWQIAQFIKKDKLGLSYEPFRILIVI